MLVEGLHAIGARTLFYEILYLCSFCRITDAVAKHGCDEHELRRKHTAFAVGGKEKPLRDASLQSVGQPQADLRLSLRRKHRVRGSDGRFPCSSRIS